MFKLVTGRKQSYHSIIPRKNYLFAVKGLLVLRANHPLRSLHVRHQTQLHVIFRTLKTFRGDHRAEKGAEVIRRTNRTSGEAARPAVTDQQKADLFCQLYAEVSRVERRKEDKKVNREATRILRRPRASTQEDRTKEFPMEELELALSVLKTGKAPGPDEITNEMLRNPDKATKSRLLKLFNWALREGVSPAGWRRSTIIPVHKKGKPRDDPSSYRPVALTSCMAKLMERMVATRLIYHLESQKILAKCQAGFRKNRSREEQIARIVQDAFDGLEQKKPQRSVLVLLDFSRAYDKVWKSALYKKMADCQVHGDLIRWTKSFLDDRRGRVKWNETLSKERIFREGLPQGSVLAPTLSHSMAHILQRPPEPHISSREKSRNQPIG